MIEAIDGGRYVGSGQLLEARELALDFVGERRDCVEPHHLDPRPPPDARARARA
jgi:hypothetical protein